MDTMSITDEPKRPATFHDRMIDMAWELGERMTEGFRPEPRTVVAALVTGHPADQRAWREFRVGGADRLVGGYFAARPGRREGGEGV